MAAIRKKDIPGNFPDTVFAIHHITNTVRVDYSKHSLQLSGKTVVVLDIHNFSSFWNANRQEKDRIGQLLQRFFTSYSKLIKDNDGIILKFIGDAIFCAFHLDPDNEKLRNICKAMLKHYHLSFISDFPQTDLAIIIMQSAELLEGYVGSDDYLEWSIFGVGINKMFHVLKKVDSAGYAIVINPKGDLIDGFDSEGARPNFLRNSPDRAYKEKGT